jgi:geranylgeranyl diphosphate synthase type II
MSADDEWINRSQLMIERWIAEDLDRPEPLPGRIIEAMRYSALAGGKRLRPLLLLAAAEYLKIPADRVKPAALAIEYVHTYSLIHDDLPAMDNDDLRRGKPTNHIVFGEALAILAGDGLLTEAFAKLAQLNEDDFPAQNVLYAVAGLAHASGAHGLIAGQTADLAAEHHNIGLSALEALHAKKTGAIFEAACQIPAWLTGNRGAAAGLQGFGSHFGLAFQIVDDILNVIGDSVVMGKSTGTDVSLDKATYPRVVGIDAAWKMAYHHQNLAEESLDKAVGQADWLLALLKRAVNRSA